MNDNLTKIRRNLSDVAMSDLQRWIVQSLKQKTVIQYKGLRLEAGFATYNRWQRIVYDEPRTRQRRVTVRSALGLTFPKSIRPGSRRRCPCPIGTISICGTSSFQLPAVVPLRAAARLVPRAVTRSVGRLLINNNYSGDVTIRLYHPQSPGRIFSSWRIARNKQTFLALNNRDINIAGDWKTESYLAMALHQVPSRSAKSAPSLTARGESMPREFTAAAD